MATGGAPGEAGTERSPEAAHPIPTHRTSKSVIANQRARWCGNPFPRKPLILRAPPGAQYRAHDRPHGRCNAAHCLGRDCHIAALPAIIMCFHTTVNERRRLSSARRSRRISCTRAFRVGTLLREILRCPLRMTCLGCGGCFITMTGSGAGTRGRGYLSDLQVHRRGLYGTFRMTVQAAKAPPELSGGAGEINRRRRCPPC